MCVCVLKTGSGKVLAISLQVNERQKQLVRQLRSLLVGLQASPEKTGEVLEYFFEKLTGSSITPRRLALKVYTLSTSFNFLHQKFATIKRILSCISSNVRFTNSGMPL